MKLNTNKVQSPFIWTPKQAINEMGFQALKMHVPARQDGLNRWFLFRVEVDLDSVPATTPVDITVDGRYLLSVNGQQAGRGPVRCSPLAQRFDSYELTPYLKTGRNVVAVLVHTYGVDTAFHETVKGMWNPTFGEGGLWIEGPVVNTGLAWRCIQSDAWDSNTPRVNHSLGFIEAIDANLIPEGWDQVGFDDTNWDLARPLLARGGGPESMYGGLVVRPFPILVPRGIPHLDETPVFAQRLLWSKGQIPNPALPIERRLYSEKFELLADGMLSNTEALLRDDESVAVATSQDGLDVTFTLDFGRIFTGYPMFEIEGEGGEVVEVACAERLPGEWDAAGMRADARITPFRVLGNDAHLCRYTAKPGAQRFVRFEWCAIRYMQVVIRNAPAGLKIRRVGAIATHYPVVERGAFSCSDPLLTKLWSLGAYTLRQCMHDAWEDCPSREQRQWLGDVTVEQVAAWAAFGDSAAPLTAKFLIQAAESQRPDGLTQMYAPGDHMENGNLIPDWTLQWVLCAGDYWWLTGDLDTIEIIWPSIQKALQWFERICGAKGLITNMPYWHFMDWAGLGRQGEAAAVNAQYAGALRVAGELAQALGASRFSEQYEARADQIISALDSSHWDERRGVWVDMVDPATGTQDLRVSQHANAGMALWGNLPKTKVARAFVRATDAQRETTTAALPVVPVGSKLDEEEGVVMANTFYGHFVCEALARHGRTADAVSQIRRRFAPMIDAGASTLWEAMSPFASLCHGFSASPTYFLSRHILGVAPASPGFAAVRVSPDIADLEFAEGTVPAGERNIKVRLDRNEEGFTAIIQGCQLQEVVAAAGWTLVEGIPSEGKIHARFVRESVTP